MFSQVKQTFNFLKFKIKVWYSNSAFFLQFWIIPLLPQQIVGEIKAAREAVVEVTSRLRSYLYRDFYQRDTVPPSASVPNMETSSSNITPVHEGYTSAETPATHQNVQPVAAALPFKVIFMIHWEFFFFLSSIFPSWLIFYLSLWEIHQSFFPFLGNTFLVL